MVEGAIVLNLSTVDIVIINSLRFYYVFVRRYFYYYIEDFD